MLFDWSPVVLLALIEGLPEGSAYVASVRAAAPYREPDPNAPAPPPDFREWTRLHDLLAEVVDAVNLNTVATGNWRKGKTPQIPPYPRPRKKKPLRVADLRRMFGG